MAATWTITGFHGSSNTDTSSSRRELTDTAALAFGGGGRSSSLLTAIQKDYPNFSLHIADAATETPGDTCPSPHLHVLSYALDTAGYCYNDGVYQEIDHAASTPNPCKGLEFRFDFPDTEVEITQCDIWAGNGAAVTNMTQSCAAYFVELADGDGNAMGADVWSKAFYGSALSLHPWATAAYSRTWYCGISIVASAVGFTNTNKMKIEATYQ